MALNGSYVVRETTSNLTRNITLTVASVLTVFVSLAILGVAILVRQSATNATQRFEGGVEFIVDVEAGATDAELASVKESLEENPGVKSAKYGDQDATYKDFQRLFKGQETMLDNVRPQDLPTSFKVEPVDKSPEVVQELVNFYRKQPNVYYVSAAIEVLDQIKTITTRLNFILTIFAAFLLVASTLLILNTIRTAMFARRREIEVMKLVGATNWFIRVPFMLEGMVQGLLGGLLGVVAVIFASRFLNDLFTSGDRVRLLETFRITSSDVTLAALAVVGSAVLLSVISSAIATRRFLDV